MNKQTKNNQNLLTSHVPKLIIFLKEIFFTWNLNFKNKTKIKKIKQIYIILSKILLFFSFDLYFFTFDKNQLLWHVSNIKNNHRRRQNQNKQKRKNLFDRLGSHSETTHNF